MQPQEGQRIKAPFLPHEVKVVKFEPRAGYTLLQDRHQTFCSLTVTDDQLVAVEVMSQDRVVLTENAEDFFFFIEANRIRLVYQFDLHLAISVSQVDPLPHQIEAVYHYALQSPRLRFLIADNPSTGKTIMVGLILKELQCRRLARRILIVAPRHLKYQWQREMKDKFQTSLVVVDRVRMDSTWGENAREEAGRRITSLDFVKQDEIRSTLAGTRWDLVIVDEAHKMAV